MSRNSPENYSIGKAYIAIRLKGTTTFFPVGNAPLFTYTSEVEMQEHFSDQVGPKFKDFEIPVQVGASIGLTLDEITGANLAMHLNGTMATLTQAAVVEQVLNIGDVVADQVYNTGILGITSLDLTDDLDAPVSEGIDYQLFRAAGVVVFKRAITGVSGPVSASEIEASANRAVISSMKAAGGIECEMLVIGTGTGNAYKGEMIHTILKPAGSTEFISQEFMQLEFEGAVLGQPGDYPFGKWTQLGH